MRTLVVGLGVQGQKRCHHAGADLVGTVDPINVQATYRDIRDVPLSSFDAALCCIPDDPKFDSLSYLLSSGKHVLVEKPLSTRSDNDILQLEALAQQKNLVCYTAYNHRFEPHFMRMRDLVASGELGKIYHCRMFYGNGTARLVRESAWRDKGAGVLPDLGSHLLDTCRFWFGDSIVDDFHTLSAHCFENRSPDHVIIGSLTSRPSFELEMTLLMWRNHFTCDIFAEKGSAHIQSLCKWGPATFIHRTRVLPSGKPIETVETLTQADPTWELEYAHFKMLVEQGIKTDLSNDIWLQKTLRQLGNVAIKQTAAA